MFPVFDLDNEYAGFLSVSGYAGDAEKTRAQTLKISEKYGLPMDEMLDAQKSLRTDAPPFERMRTLMQPLVHMFSLLQMHLEEVDASSIETDASNSTIFSRIRRFLRNDYATNYSLSDIAREFGCSESHISHLFHEHAGCGDKQYVNTMRVNIAKVFLASTNMNMQEISDLLGYANSNYFSTVFRSLCGMSPRAYRKALPEKALVSRPRDIAASSPNAKDSPEKT